MSDAFDTYQDRIASFQQQLPYASGAVGVALSIADRVISIDVFDKPATCEKVWGRLLTGIVFDAIEAGETESTAVVSDVEQVLATTNALPWEQGEAVGEGEEYRAESEQGDHASALAFTDTVVHGSLVTAV